MTRFRLVVTLSAKQSREGFQAHGRNQRSQSAGHRSYRFLGAGKTTLLNRILTADHGRRVAVIVNEFGEVGIDHHLLISSDQEIVEMSNGCICCTVRGDLLRSLFQLLEHRDKFDTLMIETTGLADPAPVVQSFFVDDRIKS